ncbi:hypothetical protein [Paraburkholderia sp. DHOC27]|uniref:hypothetical protein n=1 Tax=Paraburkholderia sp. DHOC27 TaxID=2303330 RepID=UPI00216AC199|nr:hypothetical protein [Paraburkholderia sp. DHOC27]
MEVDYEFAKQLSVEINGRQHGGQYRVLGATVIVYYESEIKFADFGVNRPELVAKWLLTDLVRRGEMRKRNGKNRDRFPERRVKWWLRRDATA